MKTHAHFNKTNMKKINEEDFKDFTIACHGFSITLSSLRKIMREWENLNREAVLYGNRRDGSRVVLDTM